jgi:hypothetical protein
MIFVRRASLLERKKAFLMAALDYLPDLNGGPDVGNYMFSLLAIKRSLREYPMGVSPYKIAAFHIDSADWAVSFCLKILDQKELRLTDIEHLTHFLKSALNCIHCSIKFNK